MKTLTSYMTTQYQKATWEDVNKIKVYNPKPKPIKRFPKIQYCEKIDLTEKFKHESVLSLGRLYTSDIHVVGPLKFNKNGQKKFHVSRQHLDLIRKKNGAVYLRPNKHAKNGTWTLILGVFPWKLRGKEVKLHHGNKYYLGKPWQCKSFFDWSIGETVKIEYYKPIPFPYNVLRFIENSLKKSAIAVGSLIALFLLWLGLSWSSMPGAEALPVFNGAPVVIFANDLQTPLKPLPAQRPTKVENLSQFGQYLPQAVVASEDRRFYKHFGVDPIGILRAGFNVIFLQSSQGASTLDQQVARTLYPEWVGREAERQLAGTILAKPATVWRKLREMPLAIKIDANHSKDEVLLAYLNAAPLGREKYGFVEAAEYYFRKPVSQLSLAEVSTLVAMLPEPNNFIDEGLCSTTGQGNLNRLSERRRRVVDWMVREGHIENQGIARLAKRIPVTNLFDASVCSGGGSSPILPRIYNSVVYKELYNLMQEEYKQGNLVVETTLNPRNQQQAQATLANFINSRGQQRGVSQGALVSIDPKSGGIRALVEAIEPQAERYLYTDPDTKEEVQTDDRDLCIEKAGNACIKLEYNFATQENLPPGSTFKALAYTAAIEKGVSPNKIYNCQPVTWEGETFSAKNWKDSYCESERGNLDMLTAMGTSDNLTALKVAKDAGLEKIIETAKTMGIQSPLEENPRLVLGGSPVKLMEMTSAYGVLANRGYKKRPHVIERIVDISPEECTYRNYKNNPNCVVLYAVDGNLASGLKPDTRGNGRVLPEAVADKMTVLMRGTVADGNNGRPRGTAANVNIRNAAGKTGTSDKREDLWFVGYVPNELVTGVWLGNPYYLKQGRTQVTSGEAAQVWQDYMRGVGYR